MQRANARTTAWFVLGLTLSAGHTFAADIPKVLSYPPLRPLPVPSNRPMDKGPSYFVDPVKGADRNQGTAQAPWKTLGHALKQLKPGDTLYLRGGMYYECVTVTVRATAEKPVTIRSYPGELAILDGGLREFFEDPANAWEPFPQGAEGEFRSTRAYTQGGGFGNFADSMVPLHRYLNYHDLRSKNELWHAGLGGRKDDPAGMYCGPGVRRDPETGRIHVRLAHTRLAGLGDSGYRGETDPRKLPLVIAGHDYALRIEGARHVRIQDLVVRGAERSAVVITEDMEATEQDAEDIELDGVTLYGSGAALRVGRTRGLRLIHCALRGHAAPWHSRAHHKYRAGAGYLVYAAGRDFEFAHCEFTDHHDCIHMYFVDGMRFHHNRVDNFNDDGIEVGPKKERGRTHVYQNLISRCLNPFTLHGKPGEKPAPVDSEKGSGVYIYRNVVDLRQGTYRSPPTEPDPSGAFLNSPTTMLAHDHGSPTHPVYYVYHNTFLLRGSAMRDYYAFTWGSHTRLTTRRVFNNIFVQVEGVPGLNFSAVSADDDFQADGNLHWGVKDGPGHQGDFFGKFRKSALFEASKKQYPLGWGAGDRFADPRFASFGGEGKQPPDLRLRNDSPAIDAGVALPADWPDPLRTQDKGKPDSGAFPLGAEPFRVGPTPATGRRGQDPEQGLSPDRPPAAAGADAPAFEVAAVLRDERALARAHDVEVLDGFAYVAGKGGSIAILDVSQPAQPRVVWSAFDPKAYEEAETVLPLGNTLLVGTRDLLLFDCTNRKEPKLAATLQDRTKIDLINGLVRSGSVVYGANKKGFIVAAELAKPTTLRLLGGRAAGARDGLTSPHDLALKDDLLVVADSNSFGRGGKPGRVGVYRVSDPSGGKPLPPEQWKLLGVLEKPILAGCNRVRMSGRLACVACALNPDAARQLGRNGCVALIDLTDPTALRLRGVVAFPDPRGPNGLTVAGKVAFAAGGHTVQAIDISEPDKPAVLFTADLPETFTGGDDDAHDLVYHNGWLYVTAQTTHALVVLRVRSPRVLEAAAER